MKTTGKQLITTLLCVVLAKILIAQQGLVVTGGDLTGPGGSLSYSVGQVDFRMFGSETGNINFGLQQPWFWTIPAIYEVPDLVVSSGESHCFNAIETVIVGGENKQFLVMDGGYVEIIAGNNIVLKHGTKVQAGGYLRAHISNEWCNRRENILASHEPDEIHPVTNTSAEKSSFFRVYPNPTTGNFTLEILDDQHSAEILIEIFTILGQRLNTHSQTGSPKLFNLSLSDKQPGIYIIKVLRNNEADFVRIIKQ